MPIITALVKCAVRARGKAILQAFLREHKTRLDLPRNSLRTAGSIEQLEESVRSLVVSNAVNLPALRSLVDEIEENGSQHIFLYRLTDAGHEALSARQFARRFERPPDDPTTTFYSQRPNLETYFVERPAEERTLGLNGRINIGHSLLAKQLRVASFWEIDREQSERTATRRVTVTVLRRRRAVNVLRILPDQGLAELRIDAVKGSNDQTLALEHMSEFTRSLAGFLDPQVHLEPIHIKTKFPLIVAAMQETYMSTDRADKTTVHQAIANRRAPRAAPDVRLNEDYSLRGPTCSRESINIYWRMPTAPDQLVHSIVSSVEIDGVEHTKLFIQGKISPQELDHVIARVRHFAALAS